MKYIPLKNFLGKPLKLQTGNVYYEKELEEAIQKYEAQFRHRKERALMIYPPIKIVESKDYKLIIQDKTGKEFCFLKNGESDGWSMDSETEMN